ncbi:thiol-disulfide isomerase-like thioredoxin [Burkholderiales bacterium JOSHI_001]|nr:thiol-disulfide isomerase-like thioredoxin [Burkholderiales bacterium JOSHI_001]
MVAAIALAQPLHVVAATPAAGKDALVAIGDALPELTMTGLNGPSRSLKSFSGRRLIVNVWASWCGPCRAEAASLERFAWSERGQKYTVIGISTDDDRSAAELWLKQSNATLSHFIDKNLVLEHIFGASSIPLTVLVDERGKVIARVRGAKKWDDEESFRLVEREFGIPSPSPRK